MQKRAIFLGLIFFSSCTGTNKTIKNEDALKSNDAISVHQQAQTTIDSLNKWIRKDMDIRDIEIKGDTLKFLSDGWFFYYPLGKYDTINPIRSKYPFFNLKIEADTVMQNAFEIYRMTFKDGFVKFIKDDDTRHMEIVYGKIMNNEVVFSNGFKVGLDKDLFFRYFFKKQIHLGNIKNIKISSALDGVFHYYHFEKDTISSITIDTDYQIYKF